MGKRELGINLFVYFVLYLLYFILCKIYIKIELIAKVVYKNQQMNRKNIDKIIIKHNYFEIF